MSKSIRIGDDESTQLDTMLAAGGDGSRWVAEGWVRDDRELALRLVRYAISLPDIRQLDALRDSFGLSQPQILAAARELERRHEFPDATVRISATPPMRNTPDPSPFAIVSEKALQGLYDRLFASDVDDTLSIDSDRAGEAADGPKCVTIRGMLGSGKTEFALAYANKYVHQYRRGVVWVKSSSYLEVTDSLSVVHESICPGSPGPAGARELCEAVKDWCEADAGIVLLILDGVTHLSVVEGVLPTTDSCHVLITTRRDLADLVEYPEQLPVGTEQFWVRPLPAADGATLLLRRVYNRQDASLTSFPAKEREAARRFSALSGGLPQVLCNIADDIKRQPHSGNQSTRVADYLTRHHRLGALPIDDRLRQEVEKIKDVKKSKPFAEFAVDVGALLGHEPIPAVVFANLKDDKPATPQSTQVLDFLTAINESSASIVQADRREQLSDVHNYVRDFVQDRMDESELRRWSERAFSAVKETIKRVGDQCDLLVPHAVAVAELFDSVKMEFSVATQAVHNIVKLLFQQGREEDARRVIDHATERLEQKVALSDDVRSDYLLALFCYYRQDYEGAASQLERLVRSQKRWCDKKPSSERLARRCAMTHNTTGEVYHVWGRELESAARRARDAKPPAGAQKKWYAAKRHFEAAISLLRVQLRRLDEQRADPPDSSASEYHLLRTDLDSVDANLHKLQKDLTRCGPRWR
jgi:hypothetical protein